MPYSKEDKLIAYSKDETKEQEVKIRLVTESSSKKVKRFWKAGKRTGNDHSIDN